MSTYPSIHPYDPERFGGKNDVKLGVLKPDFFLPFAMSQRSATADPSPGEIEIVVVWYNIIVLW